MKTICTIYKTYEEWKEQGATDVLELILDKEREINTQDFYWYEDTIQDWTYRLAELGFDVTESKYETRRRFNKELNQWEESRYLSKTNNIAFRGFGSQGDGSSFTGYVDPAIWIEKNEPVKYARIKKLIDSNAIDVYRFKITRSGRYVHEKSTDIQFDWNNVYRTNCENIMALLRELEADMESNMVDLGQQIYRELEKEHDDLESDEAIISTIVSNEYEYDEFGNRG